MKDSDMKCVQCSLCQDWVHLKCFVMAAGLEEAVFQETKVLTYLSSSSQCGT